MPKDDFATQLAEHLALFAGLNSALDLIVEAGETMIGALASGHKILACGNGGSAADAQHFAAEIVVRLVADRDAWPAIALTTDTSVLTAVANDYGFDAVFARQVDALGRPGDVLLCISTSGDSPNVLRAANAARARSIKTVGLLGRDGGRALSAVDTPIVVPGGVTARIQEAHGFIMHFWCSMIEGRLAGPGKTGRCREENPPRQNTTENASWPRT